MWRSADLHWLHSIALVSCFLLWWASLISSNIIWSLPLPGGAFQYPLTERNKEVLCKCPFKWMHKQFFLLLFVCFLWFLRKHAATWRTKGEWGGSNTPCLLFSGCFFKRTRLAGAPSWRDVQVVVRLCCISPLWLSEKPSSSGCGALRKWPCCFCSALWLVVSIWMLDWRSWVAGVTA